MAFMRVRRGGINGVQCVWGLGWWYIKGVQHVWGLGVSCWAVPGGPFDIIKDPVLVLAKDSL